ncbi:MAG: AAA family ATPase [Deltaproteobacteria bacterium]|nr:AAA family ATPase [Deltaproteobacteria bacterium]
MLRELRESSDLQPLTRCRHLLVIFESEGAAWLDFSERTTPANAIDACRVQFVYDAAAIEGEHARQIKGTAFGFLSCLAASVAWQMTRNLETPDFAAALEQGLSAMRDLREKGHGSVSHPGAGFPAERLAAVIKDPGYRFSRAEFPGSAPKSAPASPKSAGMGPSQAWSLLVDSQRCRQRTDDQPAYELARLVLLNGPIALYDVPHVGIGNLIAVHRDEIESLRTLDQLICRYRDHDKGKLPLSIGIFGPPGSGKSFAVSQLAEALLGKQRWLEFNLSQFDTLAELNGAFHQIRDRVLQQQLPVAFFDEFDSQHYRWLQYLLAPMQDGKFQQGQLTHTLGKCIFVFAGATSLTFETFGPPAPSQDALDDERKAHREFVLAKGPDFRSRLDAYLDVVGPNRRMVVAPPDKKAGKSKRAVSNGNNEITETISGYSFREDLEDLTFPISRALMIRSKLGCARDEKLDIDEALVRALLRAERYRHGARSLDKILQPLQAARPGRLQRSLLPPRGQLDMQTHATGFLAQCDGAEPARTVPPMSEADVAAVAPAIHRVWRELGRKGGWLKPWLDAEMADLPAAIEKYNKKQKDPEERKPPWLGKFLIESNREAAGRMPEILDIVGLRLASGRWAADEEAAVRQHLEYHLELLAEAEHHRWMQWHLQQGWRYAAKKDEDHKRHDCLLPFAELAEVQKNKDRDAIRHYPDFAKEAGKKIVFAAADDPHATKPRRSAAKP